MTHCPGSKTALTRRQALQMASSGFGYTALSALLSTEAGAGTHFKPKARNVVFLFMPGGVSHMESFDPKPKLTEMDGKPAKLDNYVAGPNRRWLGQLWSFKQYGQCGAPVSELFPHIAGCVDDLAIVRSMKSEFPLHARGNIFLHTGRNIGGFPSLGSWINYGLGSLNNNLPGYVLLRDASIPPGGIENYSNGFLPATHQATMIRDEGAPVENIAPADSNAVQRAKLDALLEQDRSFLGQTKGDGAIAASISNYEMAYRMQSLVPDVLELSKESEATKKLYGLDSEDKPKRLYGLQCLRARRLLEAGVRFVEVTCPNLFGMNGTWDQHSNLRKEHERNAFVTDQAVTALVKDLKQRGLFNETLIVWASEFGRTPDSGPKGDGRDHHPDCFTIWMAGAGVKGGVTYGETDELGNKIVKDAVTIHDFHATILHLLGMDHEKLTYRTGGREQRLTDVHGQIVKGILA